MSETAEAKAEEGKEAKGIVRKDRKEIAEQAASFGGSSLEGLSTGYYWIDWVGGDEGFLIPRGGVTEVAGLQQAGKSSLLLELVAYNQQLAESEGRVFKVLWADYERSLVKQKQLAINLGVRFDENFIVIQPITLEGGAQFIIERCRSNTQAQIDKRPDLVVIDTAAAARPAVEYSNKIGQTKQPGIRGKLWAEFYRNLIPELDDGGPAVVTINQIFQKLDISGMGRPGAVEYDSPGSNALKFYAVARYFLIGKGVVVREVENPYTYDVDKMPVAGITEIRGEKTKYGSPFRTARWVNYFGKGINPIPTMVKAAMMKGEKTGKEIIRIYQKGARFDVLRTPGDEGSGLGMSVLGKENFIEALKDNEEAVRLIADHTNDLFIAQIDSWYSNRKNAEIPSNIEDSVIKEEMSDLDVEALRAQLSSQKNVAGDSTHTDEEVEEMVKQALSERETSDKV